MPFQKGHPQYAKGGRPKGSKIAKTLAREAGRARALRREEITAERTMLEIARMAFANRTAVFRDGRLLPLEEWPLEAQALLEGFEVIIKNAAAGDGHTDTVHKVHLAKKLGALELLAKHFGLVTDKSEVLVKGQLELVASALDRIKERNRAKSSPEH